jgi:hypothetical protein
MSNEAITDAVTRFYDSHPINEDQILHALRQPGADLANLSQDDLSGFPGGFRAPARQATLDRRMCAGRQVGWPNCVHRHRPARHARRARAGKAA